MPKGTTLNFHTAYISLYLDLLTFSLRALHEVPRRSKCQAVCLQRWKQGEHKQSFHHGSRATHFFLGVIHRSDIKPSFFPSTEFTWVSKSRTNILKRVLEVFNIYSSLWHTYSLVRIKHIFVGQVWVKVLFLSLLRTQSISTASYTAVIFFLNKIK